MVKHDQLGIEGAPWPIQQDRGRRPVLQAGVILRLGRLLPRA